MIIAIWVSVTVYLLVAIAFAYFSWVHDSFSYSSIPVPWWQHTLIGLFWPVALVIGLVMLATRIR